MEETIGQQLQQARQSQQLTLEQVASATLMRVRYLRALEEGDFAAMPSMAQARGFLRAYASYLKLDPEPLLKELTAAPPGILQRFHYLSQTSSQAEMCR